MELRRVLPALLLCGTVGVLGLGAAACGNTGAGSSTPTAPSTLTISHQWARSSPAGATNGVAYFTITSPTADRLVGVATDAGVAGMAQLHESTVGSGGEMSMQHVDGIDLVAGMPFVLEPGGYHVMLMTLSKALKTGDTISLIVTLSEAGEVKVDVPVRDEAP